MKDELDIPTPTQQHDGEPTTLDGARQLLNRVVEKHGRGEKRPQQETMVESVAKAIDNEENLIIQAGTGTGKGIGYLVPVIASGKRAVISTATKQLSEQLVNEDMPFLDEVAHEHGYPEVTYSVLKGRASYLCLRKLDDLNRLDAQEGNTASTTESLFSTLGADSPTYEIDNTRKKRVEEIQAIDLWAKRAGHDGDRSNGPVVSDETWRTVSSTPAECPGRSHCPFGEVCFSEIARERAANSQIVMTNHALVATELGGEEPWFTLGKRDVVVFDEVHELDNYLSNIWGTALNSKRLEDALRVINRSLTANMATEKGHIATAEDHASALQDILYDHEDTLVETEWEDPIPEILSGIFLSLTPLYSSIERISRETKDVRSTIALKTIDELLESIAMLRGTSEDTVRWIGDSDGKRSLCAAPLRVGPRLVTALEEAETKMVATSATISVGGSFDIPARNFALDESPYPYHALDVGTPFNYPKQGVLYVPSPQNFPAPTGVERLEHNEAVLEELLDIVQAAGGRTLALSTTSAGARRMADYLREHVDTPVFSQFDAPPAVIARKFEEEETSTLCATMGMWHGLNVPGRTLSAVVIDKIPFPPMNDPLTKARINDVNARGGNGFMDVYVAGATVMLAQGAGRLIRHTEDRGIVAVLDVRLRTARYGQTILSSLPELWLTENKEATLGALRRLLNT